MTQIMLVAMPWTVTQAPSIQLGILQGLLDREGLTARAAHLYVAFFDEIARRLPGRRVQLEFYDSFGEAFGEWCFSVPPFRVPDEASDARWRAIAEAHHPRAWVDLAFRVRALVPAFLERCADELLAHNPRVVGFSSTFQQTVPSLALAKVLKQRDPSVRIVFGGANCEAGMGAGLIRLFPQIDAIVRGEAEGCVPRLFRELVEGAEISPHPGLCVRAGDRVTIWDVAAEDNQPALARLGRHRAPEPSPRVDMAAVPVPVYDDYVERVRAGSLGAQLDKLWLPYESARGCWWATTKVCTFCAANATYTTFRSKPAAQVQIEVESLAERYESPHVWFVDNIMDERYGKELFPAMAGRRDRLAMFVETRAHVSRAQLAAMRDAGVVMVQLGIESFSSSILKLIDKGTTALQNLRVIKWCAELGIQAFYNVIYGFPGEDPEEYARMADLVPALTHLEAPNAPVQLRLDRFSPYHRDPARYGIEVTGPRPSRVEVFGLDASTIEDIEYFFTFRYRDGRDPSRYVERFLEVCRLWRARWREDFGMLAWVATPEGGLKIHDLRRGGPRATYELGPLEARIYRGCDAGATASQLWEALGPVDRMAFDAASIDGFLDMLVVRGLACRDGKKVLALAVDMTAPAIAPRWASPPEQLADAQVRPLVMSPAARRMVM
jgi:ribosomal peptide maturation radical SAM protein 1